MMLLTTDVVGNTGTRFLGGLLTMEMVAVLGDMRWMLLLIALCVVADFRYGWGESAKRYKDAVAKGDELGMAQYHWRTSRAVRRSVNKAVDYAIWATLGMALGMALLEPIGVNHALGGVVATAIAVMCEAKSFVGHFFYLHGVTCEEKTLTGFAKAVAVALAKRKSRDLGEALEEGFRTTEKDNGKKGKDGHDVSNDRQGMEA